MVRVTQLAEDGTELAAVEVDDFTIEVIYAGLAEMLRAAAAARPGVLAPACDLTRQAHQRRQRVLSRIRD
jgi:hypothetical protein